MGDRGIEAGGRIEVYFDGRCSVCAGEARLLQRLDRRRRLRLVDVSAPGFEARRAGVGKEALLERIHARLPDGTVVEGVEALRRLHAAVGLGPLVTLSRLPGLSRLLELGYRWLARNRYRVSAALGRSGGPPDPIPHER